MITNDEKSWPISNNYPSILSERLRNQRKTMKEEEQKGQNYENVPWVLVLVRVDSVLRKRNTIEERHQDQSYLFQRGH